MGGWVGDVGDVRGIETLVIEHEIRPGLRWEARWSDRIRRCIDRVNYPALIQNVSLRAVRAGHRPDRQSADGTRRRASPGKANCLRRVGHGVDHGDAATGGAVPVVGDVYLS